MISYDERPRAPRSRTTLFVWGSVALTGFVLLMALGVWQIERRAWKLNLIAQVNSRLHEPAQIAPGPDQWSTIGPTDAYRPVRIHGRFRNDKTSYVQASTVHGMGYWVITPLVTDKHFTVLINRGFIPPAQKQHEAQIAFDTTVTGLLRITEQGRWLRPNKPAQGLWYSRDIAAIGVAQGLTDVAPYFIDANAADQTPSAPQGGLTIVAFPNNHLLYAFTWFGLAAMLVFGAGLVIRDEIRLRRMMR